MTKLMSILAIAGAMAGFCVLGPADSLAQSCPEDADERGCWEPLIDFGMGHITIHAVMLKTGKVLCTYVEDSWVFDPADNSVNDLLVKPDEEIFCSGHCQLPDGRVVFMGGGHPEVNAHQQTVIFDPDKAVEPYNDPAMWTYMDDIPPIDPPDGTRGRWYPTCTTLGDGKVLLLAGGYHDEDGNSDLPLVFNATAATNQYTALTLAEQHFPWYPFTYLLPDGDIFVAGSEWYPNLDTNCTDEDGIPTCDCASMDPCVDDCCPIEGSCPAVTQTLNLALEKWTEVGYKVGVSNIMGGSAVMYRPGRVMKAGGNFDPDPPPGGTSCPTDDSFATREVRVVNLNVPTPEWDSKALMNHPRVDFYLVPMPDGNVLAIGDGTLPVPTREPEVYDVSADTWSVMNPMDEDRTYHSAAVLLPSAKVLIAGGGPSTTAQVFDPPYLFTNGNEAADQPHIVTAPAEIYYNTGFGITTGVGEAVDITRVSLIRLGSATHSMDFDARFVPINFTFHPQYPDKLRMVAPPHKFRAPPGYYMLFILDDGVPCEKAAIVKLRPPPP